MNLPAALAGREIVSEMIAVPRSTPSASRSRSSRPDTLTGEFAEATADKLTHKVLKVITHRVWTSDPSVEDIQDIVEQVLIDAVLSRHRARAYIVYREQRRRVREDRRAVVDAVSSVNEYPSSRPTGGACQRQPGLHRWRADLSMSRGR